MFTEALNTEASYKLFVENNLRRALDRVLRERGPDSYARFKSRLRLASRRVHRALPQPSTAWS